LIAVEIVCWSLESKEGRQKALETTLAGLNKRYGEGVVMKLGETSRLAVESIPTGSLSLDIAIRVGGVHVMSD
jgi:recombination protein RecA